MKRWMKVVGIGVGIGLVLLAVQQLLQIPADVFLRWYWVVGGLVVLGAATINLLYARRYHTKIKAAARLLEEGRPREFLEQVEALLQTAKGRYLRNLLTINLSAGYAALKEYDQALQALEGLAGQRLPGVVKVVYHLNLCACYFYTGQGDRAMAVYQASQKEFAPFAQGKTYGGNLAVLDVFAALHQGQPDRAASLLAHARERWPMERLQEHYGYLADRLEQAGWADPPVESNPEIG